MDRAFARKLFKVCSSGCAQRFPGVQQGIPGLCVHGVSNNMLHWTCCGSTDFTSECPIVRQPLGVVQIKSFLHLDKQRALVKAMLQRHMDDKAVMTTREGILGFTRDSLVRQAFP